jgi:hypothetical protein
MRTRLPHSLPIRRSPRASSLRREQPLVVPDPAVLRVRRAGGPVDEASYTCECGFVFRARVSTTVACPHCEAQQPW